MHKGEIKKLIRDRGFGFIKDVDGREVFFHRNSVLDVQFDTIREGQKVEFEVEKTPKGPRGMNVRIVED